ncbi:general stress protein [Lentzea sp. NPDC051213]|uniref:general stress protein n=1 Tax=Lentzea sp. NPDC051213 TaxID=3364126 RepID=UPI003789C956
MTTATPFATGAGSTGVNALPTLPTGWPIGSYGTYEEAQRAVDHLADNDFPVADVTIVGVDAMIVERVTGRLTWGRVLGAGAASGAWFGLFVGLLLGLFSTGGALVPIITGLVMGTIFGLTSAAIRYSGQRGRRDFASTTQLVAGRYDVLSQPRNAERGKEMLTTLAWRSAA